MFDKSALTFNSKPVHLCLYEKKLKCSSIHQLQTAVIRMSDNDVRSIVQDLVEIFIEAGIHLDAVNCDGLKASQVCVQSNVTLCTSII